MDRKRIGVSIDLSGPSQNLLTKSRPMRRPQKVSQEWSKFTKLTSCLKNVDKMRTGQEIKLN